MSLTSILKESGDLRKQIPNLKKILVDLNGNELAAPDWKREIIVRSVGKSHESGFIGTAFDYVVRALLTKWVGNQNVEKQQWIAVDALKGFRDAFGRSGLYYMFLNSSDYHEERAEGYRLAQKHLKRIIKYLNERLESAIDSMDGFVTGNASLESIATHALFLSRLDVVYRSGSIVVVDDFFDKEFGKKYFSQTMTLSDEELVENVVRMVQIFENEYRDLSMSKVYLNPKFAQYTDMVGGADADFIFDSTLIDLKTTNKLSYSTKDWAQVLGYAAMALELGMNIERVGIYFARYGMSTMFELSSEMKIFLSQYLKQILNVVEEADRRKEEAVQRRPEVEKLQQERRKQFSEMVNKSRK